MKQTFIGSLSCSSPCIRRVVRFERCRPLVPTVKLFLSTSRTKQDAEGYRLTVVWFHTTFGQTSHSMTQQFNHQTLWIFCFCFCLIQKHPNTLTVVPWYPFPLQLIELCKSPVFLILPLCSFLSSSSPNQAAKPTQQITN